MSLNSVAKRHEDMVAIQNLIYSLCRWYRLVYFQILSMEERTAPNKRRRSRILEVTGLNPDYANPTKENLARAYNTIRTLENKLKKLLEKYADDEDVEDWDYLVEKTFYWCNYDKVQKLFTELEKDEEPKRKIKKEKKKSKFKIPFLRFF